MRYDDGPEDEMANECRKLVIERDGLIVQIVELRDERDCSAGEAEEAQGFLDDAKADLTEAQMTSDYFQSCLTAIFDASATPAWILQIILPIIGYTHERTMRLHDRQREEILA